MEDIEVGRHGLAIATGGDDLALPLIEAGVVALDGLVGVGRRLGDVLGLDPRDRQLHAVGEGRVQTGLDQVFFADRDLEHGEQALDVVLGGGLGGRLAVRGDRDALGRDHRQREAGAAEHGRTGGGQLGVLGTQAEFGEGLADGRRRGPVLLGLTVDGDGQFASIADDDGLPVGDGRVDGRHDQVVRSDGDAFALQHIADGAGEGVNRIGLPLDREVDRFVEVGDTGHSGREDAHNAHLGQAPYRKKVQVCSKVVMSEPTKAFRAATVPR